MFTVRRTSDGVTIVSSIEGSISTEPICRFLTYLAAKGHSPNTVLAYAHDIVRLWTFLSSKSFDWRDFSADRSVDFLLYLRSVPSQRKHRERTIRLVTEDGGAVPARLSAATINRMLVTVSAFFDWAIFTGAFSGQTQSPGSRTEHPGVSPTGIDRS
jgi:site-specific recombinase XerD